MQHAETLGPGAVPNLTMFNNPPAHVTTGSLPIDFNQSSLQGQSFKGSLLSYVYISFADLRDF